METSVLTPTQKYAAAALFALALHKSQSNQSRDSKHLLPPDEEPIGDGISISKSNSVSDNPQLWIHENSGLLLPVFRFLGVDGKAWNGLQETAGSSSQVRHHVGAFLTLLSEDSDGTSSDRKDKELALRKAVDATADGMEKSPASSEEAVRSQKYENECIEKYYKAETQSMTRTAAETFYVKQSAHAKMPAEGKAPNESGHGAPVEAVEEGKSVSYQRKVTALYELLSACLAHEDKDDNKSFQQIKGYDARHRTALRLLATWLSIEWTEMEALETVVACSIMSFVKKDGEIKDESTVSASPSASWKRGGIIGAAALTGGTLMALTGGLVAPAIAEGLGALAPTLGSIIPAIGASGFAAAATATGSVAGSVAIAASFGAAGAGLTGSKMARRTAGLEEFEFREVGQNHKQGRLAVGILVSGFVMEDKDFIKPWEGHCENWERYTLWWESKNLIELGTAIEDWLTSSTELAKELIKKGAMLTVFSTLLAALSLPATLMTVSDLIDSKWAIAIDRTDKAGKLLAEVLLKGMQGNRPVTLVGFSLGARVIFKCLRTLAETEGDNAGLVERVVLLGAPVPIKDEKWEDVRKMVTGRFVNAYSTNDWILGVAFRASLLSQGLAGIQPVDINGVENVDVTEVVYGHSSYLWKTKQILEEIQLENYYCPDFENATKAKPQEQKSS